MKLKQKDSGFNHAEQNLFPSPRNGRCLVLITFGWQELGMRQEWVGVHPVRAPEIEVRTSLDSAMALE